MASMREVNQRTAWQGCGLEGTDVGIQHEYERA